MSRMVSAMVVELHPVGYQLGDFSYGLIAPKPQFLVFDASPEALDKHVVHPAAFPVHADFSLCNVLLKGKLNENDRPEIECKRLIYS